MLPAVQMRADEIITERARVMHVIQKAAAHTTAPLLDKPDPWREAAFELAKIYEAHLKAHEPQPKRINA